MKISSLALLLLSHLLSDANVHLGSYQSGQCAGRLGVVYPAAVCLCNWVLHQVKNRWVS